MQTLLTRLAAGVAVLAASAAGPVLVAAPAAAATCSGGGVNVVVDFNQLGGLSTGCDPQGGGRAASQVFPAAGFPLTYVQTQPGLVCRVSGQPAAMSCAQSPPADAYWSLWWSDGTSGSWTYSTEGVGTLDVPAGGSLGWSWQQGDARTPPSAAAPVRQAATPSATPRPTRTTSPRPTQQPSARPSRASSPSSPSTTPRSAPRPDQQTRQTRDSGSERTTPTTRSPGASPSRRAAQEPEPRRERQDRQGQQDRRDTEPDPSPSASASPTLDPEAGTDPAGESTRDDTVPPAEQTSAPAGDGGLPAYVVVLVVLMLAGAAGGVALLRRSRSGTS